MPLVKATFGLPCEDEVFEGFHDPEIRWNGYACPLFTFEVAEQVAAVVTRSFATNPDAEVVVYNPDTDVFVEYLAGYNHPRTGDGAEDGGPSPCETFEPMRMAGQKLYSIGGFEWCWFEV